jgi:tight adherence protein B
MSNNAMLLLLALTAAMAGWIVTQLISFIATRNKQRLQERIGAGGREDGGPATPSIVLPKPTDDLEIALANKGLFRGLRRKLAQAYPDVGVTRFLLITVMLALAAFGCMAIVTESIVIGLGAGVMIAMVPFLQLMMRHNRRNRLIEDQLPEALDFLARILRAGHSLATALQMAGDELPEPLAREFAMCYAKHSLGQPLEEVLREMAQRIDVKDVAFFVTAVLIQRQTGGDLAEVLKNISSMVRARIRLKQHVKAITAEGRLVGGILLVLPLFFLVILYVLNPQYAGVLFTTPEGRYMLFGGFVMQMLGMITIRRIVRVEM